MKLFLNRIFTVVLLLVVATSASAKNKICTAENVQWAKLQNRLLGIKSGNDSRIDFISKIVAEQNVLFTKQDTVSKWATFFGATGVASGIAAVIATTGQISLAGEMGLTLKETIAILTGKDLLFAIPVSELASTAATSTVLGVVLSPFGWMALGLPGNTGVDLTAYLENSGKYLFSDLQIADLLEKAKSNRVDISDVYNNIITLQSNRLKEAIQKLETDKRNLEGAITNKTGYKARIEKTLGWEGVNVIDVYRRINSFQVDLLKEFNIFLVDMKNNLDRTCEL